MPSSFAPIVQLYGVNTRLYEQALDGIDRETSLRRLAPGANPILWIAGHLASSRFGIAGMIGREQPLPWPKVFHKGSSAEDPSSLPDLAVIRQGWREIAGVLLPRLAELNEADLAPLAPRSFPIEDKSIGGAITFLAYHEGYHLGQISYVRKALGLPGLVG
jgi:hypothetical protein